jgi:hypothetical protein
MSAILREAPRKKRGRPGMKRLPKTSCQLLFEGGEQLIDGQGLQLDA